MARIAIGFEQPGVSIAESVAKDDAGRAADGEAPEPTRGRQIGRPAAFRAVANEAA